jgi:hypothetical protein
MVLAAQDGIATKHLQVRRCSMILCITTTMYCPFAILVATVTNIYREAPMPDYKNVLLQFVWTCQWNYVLRQLRAGHYVLLPDVNNIFTRYLSMLELENLPYDVCPAYMGTVPSFLENLFPWQGFTICGGMSWL